MTLPIEPPLAPALALSRKELPTGEDLSYEIKLDGFRALAFVDGDQLFLQSRGAKPLLRYFPELIFPAGRYVLDGEIVIRADGGGEDFDALQQRIHPAESRVKLLAEQTPATFVAFDLIAEGERSLLQQPFSERRTALERLLSGSEFAKAPIELMPTTSDPECARRWLQEAEGSIVKKCSAAYEPGKRTGMFKVKRVRTIDAVVAGWRPGKEPDTVGALILALYDGSDLRVVGHCSGLTAAEKRRLVGFLEPYASGERGSADPSRWTAGRDLEWVALRPELVVEIDFDHVSSGRIRHGAKLRRWRQDKPASECTYDQLQR
jgi:ATP-dependent DNA ligase